MSTSSGKPGESMVSGMASIFENSAAMSSDRQTTTASPPSAVGGLASRFEAADAEARRAASSAAGSGVVVSSKISSIIAGAFEPTAANKAVTKPSTLMPRSPVKGRRAGDSGGPNASTHLTETESENCPRQGVAQVAARFANGTAGAGLAPESKSGEQEPSAFRKAASAFEKREKELAKPVETKVASVANQFDQAARFGESINRLHSKSQDGDKPASAAQRTAAEAPVSFQHATSMFERGAHPGDPDGSEPTETVASRFKDASRLFGGSTAK
jgi:hypothetical protein